jgi:hypothetical protein
VRLTPDGLELVFLQHPKQFGLRLEGELAHFIEEQRSSLRELEPADAAIQGTGESAFHVTEQLAFHKTG